MTTSFSVMPDDRTFVVATVPQGLRTSPYRIVALTDWQGLFTATN